MLIVGYGSYSLEQFGDIHVYKSSTWCRESIFVYLLCSPISLLTWKMQNYVSSRTFFYGAHAVTVWLGESNFSLEGCQRRENPPATFRKNGCPMNTARGMSQVIGAGVVCHLSGLISLFKSKCRIAKSERVFGCKCSHIVVE